MTGNATEHARAVSERCVRAGFALAGVCRPDPSAHARELREWIAGGAHGDMDFMTEAIEVRLEPARLLDGTRSFVLVADLYAARGQNHDPQPPHAHGRVARYVRGIDYHRTVKRRLHAVCDTLRAGFPGHRFRSFTDTAPVLEREMAARAGLGWVGKNTMLIHPVLGSYMVLGGFATTLELDPPPEQRATPDHCGTCTRCIDACPTRAITPYRVDATRCISYLTIEHREEIPPEFHASIGPWVYGCDVCQEVCPHNSPAPEAVRRSGDKRGQSFGQSALGSGRATLDLLDLLGWDANDRRGAFNSSAMKRATLAMMKRNALIVLANDAASSGSPDIFERIRDAMWDANEPEMVRRTARTVLGRLTGTQSPRTAPSAET